MTEKPKADREEIAEDLENGEELMDIYTLTDEEGNEAQFELLGELELDGNKYIGLIPLENGDDEGDEYVIFKCTADENGEDLLETIEDDDEFERVADAFEDRFLSELDLDEGQDS
ncbi:MAG: DUF1292 domain-containing protein [Clostridia bacterium]|nr:DUF1292 domain-containing protein [Clostridia bacterium]MBR4467500.1 DUF1292 domain-containing protein [Clostridia bacterium]